MKEYPFQGIKDLACHLEGLSSNCKDLLVLCMRIPTSWDSFSSQCRVLSWWLYTCGFKTPCLSALIWGVLLDLVTLITVTQKKGENHVLIVPLVTFMSVLKQIHFLKIFIKDIATEMEHLIFNVTILQWQWKGKSLDTNWSPAQIKMYCLYSRKINLKYNYSSMVSSYQRPDIWAENVSEKKSL